MYNILFVRSWPKVSTLTLMNHFRKLIRFIINNSEYLNELRLKIYERLNDRFQSDIITPGPIVGNLSQITSKLTRCRSRLVIK